MAPINDGEATFGKKGSMKDSARRATANKWLHVNQRVPGALGKYTEGPTK